MSGEPTWGVAGACVGAISMWLSQRGKSKSDIEVAVIAEWQKLNSALSERLATVEKEFADHRLLVAKQIEDLRAEHAAEIADTREKHRKEMRTLREERDQLKRQLIQNSHSTAQLISENVTSEGGRRK